VPCRVPGGYVELERTFSNFQERDDLEQAAYENYFLEFFETGISWNQLIQSQCVVILAEAGSGKTWELRARAAALNKEDHTAFFIQLERLAQNSLENALSTIDYARLQSWQKQRSDAVFFLDAVDEAKITTRNALEVALNSFLRGIRSENLSRATVVLTSRISGWRGRDDRALLRRLLNLFDHDSKTQQPAKPVANGKSEKKAELRIVTMNVLSTSQIEIFAKNFIPDHAPAFLSALNSHGGLAFARRPQDVARLTKYWSRTGTLGNLTDLIEFDIRSRLQETEDDRQRDSTLDDNRLREGAEKLALAVVLGKSFSILVENESVQSIENVRYVVPSAELAGWNQNQIRNLLSRALFDPATLGQVRFHHRGVAEYLSYSCINSIFSSGFPVSDGLSLFFAQSHGEDVLIPSRAPIACWLACGSETWNQRLRKKMLEIAPEAFLVHGDPAKLDLETRRLILSSVVSASDAERKIKIEATDEQLRRLADSELTPTIIEILEETGTRDEGLELLLRLVREGALTGCIPSVLALAQSGKRTVLTHVIAAVARVGGAADKRQLVRILLASPPLEEPVTYRALVELYPTSMSTNDLIKMIANTLRPTQATVSLLNHAAKDIVDNAPRNHIEPLVNGLIDLLRRRPGVTVNSGNGGISHLVSRDFLWLVPFFRATIARALASDKIDDGLAENIVEALYLLEITKEFNPLSEPNEINLDQLSLAHPTVRRLYCWKKAEWENLRNPGKSLNLHEVISFSTILKPSKNDFHWLLEEVLPGPTVEHREIALRLLCGLSWSFDKPRMNFWSRVRRNIADSPELRFVYKELIPNAISVWFRRTYYGIQKYVKWGLRDHFRNIMNWCQFVQDRFWLFRHGHGVRKGKYLQALWHLNRLYLPNTGNGEESRLKAVESRYGKRVAVQYKEGCKAFWRQFSPQLLHEKEDRNSVQCGTIVGLAGLAFDVDDGLDWSTLSEQEAERATRYAVENLNGFPDWLSELARVHPEPVRAIFQTCAVADWSLTGRGAMGSDVTQHLYHCPPSLHCLMAQDFMELLRGRDPGTPELLFYAVALILSGDRAARSEIIGLASMRARNCPLNSSLLAPWTIIWLWLDASSALDWLEEISRSEAPEKVNQLVLSVGDWVGRNSLSTRPTDGKPSYEGLPALTRLIVLVYRYIHLDEDIDRSGTGVYTPGPRDRAQDFRNTLLSRLVNTSGHEAHEALLALVTEPALTRYRDYIVRSAASRRRQDAEPDPWQPGEAASFILTHKQPVRSAHDLFALALRKLSNLKDELENADFRRREGLPTDRNEDGLQEWLARFLQDRSHGDYSVVREPMVAHGKKPDLRLFKTPYGPVSIEVKWADNWSFSELSVALSDQLVGRYLRARQSRYGILLLVWKGEKKTWQPQNCSPIGFREVVDKLHQEAVDILTTCTNIDGLEVFGICLST